MKTTRIATAFALLLVAGSARAESSIPSNYVDDFGPLVAKQAVEAEELGAGGGEPGVEAQVAERAALQPSLENDARERYLQEVWTRP